MNHQLINFYSGIAPDTEGRYLSDILEWSNNELEDCHNYIQLLFPLEEASRFNPDAPLLDCETKAVFLNNEELRNNMVLAFYRMLAFYGLEKSHLLNNEKVCHTIPLKSKSGWITKGNHNFLRLTRILRSLNLCGLGVYADLLFEKLSTLYVMYRDVIGETTMAFWRDAAEAEEQPPLINEGLCTISYASSTATSTIIMIGSGGHGFNI